MSSSVVPSDIQTPTSGTYVPTILGKLYIHTYICTRSFNIYWFQGKVEYGIGSLSKLADVLRELSIFKPFIITGNSLATKTDVIEQVKKAAGTDIAAVFSSIKQHAPIEDIKKAVDQLKKSGGDGIIAVGGGSPIDAAKIVVSFHKEETGTLLKLVSIPTTLSAAELTIIAGYTSK
jgi:alcohol dehydrogenase class IV